MSRWTPQDEINLQRWIDDRGIKLVYLPGDKQWGYTEASEPKDINGGFRHLSELKQHLVKLKGDNKNVQIVSEGDFHGAVERIRKLSKHS